VKTWKNIYVDEVENGKNLKTWKKIEVENGRKVRT